MPKNYSSKRFLDHFKKNIFQWNFFGGLCYVWRASEVSQQVKTWPSGPFIFLSPDSWKACSLEIHPNSHWESWGPTLCPVHLTVFCNREIAPSSTLDSQTLGSQAKRRDASVESKQFALTVIICEWNSFG